MPYDILYHPDVVKEDIPKIPNNIKQRIKTAIEFRLQEHPEKYGLPLRNTLKGFWKIRAGDYRVVYQIRGKAVVVKAIMHRKDIYKEVFSRI